MIPTVITVEPEHANMRALIWAASSLGRRRNLTGIRYKLSTYKPEKRKHNVTEERSSNMGAFGTKSRAGSYGSFDMLMSGYIYFYITIK
jgi:hypothetical protein